MNTANRSTSTQFERLVMGTGPPGRCLTGWMRMNADTQPDDVLYFDAQRQALPAGCAMQRLRVIQRCQAGQIVYIFII